MCYTYPMSTTKPKTGVGIAETVLGDDIAEGEMDRLLADRHGEIDAKLREAYADRVHGHFAPLEPLHILLREAREGVKNAR